MKPYRHAELSAKVFGGEPEDYIEIHKWFDQFRYAVKSPLHRMFLHNTVGVMICEQVFGNYITNSDGDKVIVRDIAEHHITVDVGEMRTPEDWLENITDTDWVKPKKSELEKKVEKQTDKEAEKKVEEEVENDYLFTEGGGGCFHECDFTIYD